MSSPTSSSCTVVLLLLLVVMNILIVITLTGDLLVTNCNMQSAWVFCSAGVSFHPVFSPAKWLSLPVIGRQCLWERGQSAPHSTGWQPQSQPCSCCASLKKVSVSSYKFADVISFPSNRPGAPELALSPSALAFPAHLAESLLKRFPLRFKACRHSEPGHCNKVLASSQNLTWSWNVIISDQDFAF